MKKIYRRPTIKKTSSTLLVLRLIRKTPGKYTCRQCSGCHGCR